MANVKKAKFYIRQMLYLYAQKRADKHMAKYHAWRNEYSEWLETPEGEAMAKETISGTYAELDLQLGIFWQNLAYSFSPLVNK